MLCLSRLDGACCDARVLSQFECPVCRLEVTRDPLRTRTVDQIVAKTVSHLSQSEQMAYFERIDEAQASSEKARTQYTELQGNSEASVHISAAWKRKEREAFQEGIKNYRGDAREAYCCLHGLTAQWTHSADDGALNQALHNLQLQNFVSRSEEQIRRRLRLFLRYG